MTTTIRAAPTRRPRSSRPSGIQENADNAQTKLTIGSKNFTEQKVLGEIYAQALSAAGYDVSTELNLGDEKTALKALEGGEISAYPEYTGTALLSFFGVKADKLPNDEAKAFEDAKAGFAEKDLTALEPTPFVSSNEVAVTQGDRRRGGPLEDLRPRGGGGGASRCTARRSAASGSTACSASRRSTGSSSRSSCRSTSPCATRC